jgi:anaerobic magnesium-protoporphyrin IX monomethyl ester cyclase
VVPAIGLAILAARLREHEVKIYDLNHQPTLDLNADVVGVTDLYANHANAIDIMRAAKEESATTVIGGPNVSFLAERILRNNPFVDYAIVADGEDALPALLAGNKPENIPNLVFRDGERIVRNPRQRVRMDTLFDLDDVVGLDIDPGKLYTINAIRGCAKAEKEGRCSFCSLDLALNVMDPALVWEQIGILNSKYGLTRFFEAGDTFMVGKFPEKLLAARPSRLENTSFRVYASADEITPESSKLLAALHVEEIFVGVESYNDRILEQAGKGYRTADIDNAITLLHEQGIRLHLPFIYGLPGETLETAEATFRFAEEHANAGRLHRVISALAVPFPGTQLFEDIRTDPQAAASYPGDLDRDDQFDYQALIRLNLQHFTTLDFNEGNRLVERTMKLCPAGHRTSFDYNR